MAGIERDFKPGDGAGKRLQFYWTKTPEGLSKWATRAHPWRSLYAELLPKLNGNANFAARLTETYFVIVFGIHSGTRFGKNKFGPG